MSTARPPERLTSPNVTSAAVRVPWPAGFTSAACLTFDLDAEAAILSADIGAINRMGPMSHQAYGPLVGVPRVLAMLARHDLVATFFVPGYTAHRYPEVVRTILTGGHEIAHHGYLHENTIGMDARTEAAMLDLGLQALYDVAGVRPVGYRAPMWELNYHTPGLLAERGFRYDSSLMDSDFPYRLHAGDGATLIEVPVSWGLDDWEQYAFLPGLIGGGVIESPAKVLDMWTLELEAVHRIGGLFMLTCHPFLVGRPSRAEALERLIERMLALPGLWITTVSDVAAHAAALDLAPRACPQPEIPREATWMPRPDPQNP